MSGARVRRVDWRSQFGALERFLREDGGVVHVRTTASSPSSTFAKALRQEMREGDWPRPWLSVQIDGTNPNTHYVEDVVAQLERSLGLADDLVALPSTAISIGNDIEASSVTISNITLAPPARPERLAARVDRIRDAIADTSGARRVALCFTNSQDHDPKALQRFLNAVWDAGLADLTAVGLLLVDLGDPSARPIPDWPPDPDVVFDLPAQFDADGRSHAREDLAGIAIEQNLCRTHDEAVVFATTLLSTSDTVRDLHSRLALALANFA